MTFKSVRMFKKYLFDLLMMVTAAAVFLSFPYLFLGCSKNIAPVSDSSSITAGSSESQEPGQDYLEEKEEIPDVEEKNMEAEDKRKTQDNIAAGLDLSEYKPNELGQVMVLMYHQIGSTEGEWSRTPDNLRKDLQNLYENGYRLINLLDYARAEIDIEAGMSPVVVTFDDGLQGQFNYIITDDGHMLDPDCAVGILEDFCRQHPDFGKGSSFYIYYPNPFGQKDLIEKKLMFLADNGYEIGNHTYSHADLLGLTEQEVVMEIALNVEKTFEVVPGYEARSISLPYGKYPQNKDLLLEGSYMGSSYINEAVILVGSNPAPSPFSIDFDPLSIPRIRAGEINVDNSGIYDWLDYFERNPQKKYISDGKIDTVTAPQDQGNELDRVLAADRQVILY